MRNKRNKRRESPGQAILIVLVLLVLMLPLGIVFYNSTMTAMQSAVKEGQQKTSAQLATDIVTDYMRAFSNDPYNGHYDAADLGRPLAGYYANMISSVTYVANATNHTVYLSILTGIGSSVGNSVHQKHIQALIVFISNLVLYGTMFNQSAALSGSNDIYSGGFYVNGNLTESGTGVIFKGGPVVIKGSMTGAGDTVIDGNLYYLSGSNTGVTINGLTYNYVPTFTWPTFDTSYYASQAGTTTTTSQTITFNSAGTFSFSGGATYTIPSSGIIIYADNTNISISGTIKGLVTVVAYSPTATTGCGAAAGQINVTGNLYYAGTSSITATSGNSFAALASNCINFQSNSNMTVAGVYFVQGSGSIPMELQCQTTCTGKYFALYGTRSAVLTTYNYSPPWTASINYDPALRTYQPPGLPEQAYLVNFNVH